MVNINFCPTSRAHAVLPSTEAFIGPPSTMGLVVTSESKVIISLHEECRDDISSHHPVKFFPIFCHPSLV